MQSSENTGASKKLSFRTQASRRIVADKFSFVIFLLSILAILSQGFLIFFSKGRLPDAIPLYYSRPWGEQILAKSIAIWILPVTAVFVFVVNFFIAFFLTRENFFLLRILVIFAFVVCLATLYDVVKIVNLLV